MKYYVVIDTNILVSALLSAHDDATTVQIVARMLQGDLIPVYNDEIMREYRLVLNRKKFGFSPEKIDYLLSFVEMFGLYVNSEKTGEILPDIKDLPFFEVVYEIKDDNGYLITGNLKHFPTRPYIITARQMLALLSGEVPEK